MFDLFDADHDLMIVMLHVTRCGSLTKTADMRAADCSEPCGAVSCRYLTSNIYVPIPLLPLLIEKYLLILILRCSTVSLWVHLIMYNFGGTVL